MKKKFLSAIALTLAAVLSLGMTVMAEESNNTAAEMADGVTANAKDFELYVDVLDDETIEEAANTANLSFVQKVVANATKVVKTLKTFDLTPEDGADLKDGVVIDLKIGDAKLKANQSLYVLHKLKSGKWELIKPESYKDGVLSVKFTSLSPVSIIVVEEKAAETTNSTPASTTEPAPAESPKTGETLPVAGIMAVVCLAGAAVCAKRVRYSK